MIITSVSCRLPEVDLGILLHMLFYTQLDQWVHCTFFIDLVEW